MPGSSYLLAATVRCGNAGVKTMRFAESLPHFDGVLFIPECRPREGGDPVNVELRH
jgi:hypothetical protein